MMDDRALVSRVLDGDMAALKLLINQHKRLVSFMVSKLIKNVQEHEEICQDVFMKVYDKLGDFNFESKLSTWIATIAYRHAINAARKTKRDRVTVVQEPVVEDFIDFSNPETIMAEEDLDQAINRLIKGLPAQYRVVLTLYHAEGMHYDEITRITGMPEGTVKSYLFRARAILKEKVKQYIS